MMVFFGAAMRWLSRCRWWHVAGACVLMLIFTAAVVRWQGYRRWQQVRLDAAAVGLAVDAAGLLARAPAVDRDRQERLWQAMRWEVWNARPTSLLPSEDLQEGYGLADPAGRQRVLAANAAQVTAVDAILAEGPLLISVLGWMEPEAGDRDGRRSMIRRDTPLLVVREGIFQWGARAAGAADPHEALRCQDRWLRALDHPGSIIDAFSAIAVSANRDDTRLWLATRGRLAATDLDVWLAEAPAHRRWYADALAGERIDYLARVETVQFLSLPIPRLSAYLGHIPDHLHLTKYHDLAWTYQAFAAAEAKMRGLPAPAACPPVPGGMLISPLVLPDFMQLRLTVEAKMFGHRLRRIAGVLAHRYRAGHPLPATQEGLAALLPPAALDTAMPDTPAIRYECLSSSRFRLGCDPAYRPSSIPSLVWEQERTQSGSTIGSPPSSWPVVNRRWSLEIDLDAILVPAKRGR